jgi:hypothetical protein
LARATIRATGVAIRATGPPFPRRALGTLEIAAFLYPVAPDFRLLRLFFIET